MKKNVIAFGAALLFFLLALTPTINSSLLNIQSTKEGNDDLIEVEVYNFKGEYGYDRAYKKITLESYYSLLNEQENINSKNIDFEDKIKLNIQLYKDYGLIPEYYDYQYLESMVDTQKPYLERMANIGYLTQKVDKNDRDLVVNFLSFDIFFISNGAGITIGFPPWRVIWGLYLPYLPHLALWATALVESIGDPIDLETHGLLGTECTSEAIMAALIGFIGIIVFFPLVSPGSDEGHWIGVGIGFSAFCIAI